MQKIKSVFSSNIIFFLLTTLVILSLNLTPLILQANNAPSGRTFSLVHNNTQDFFFYQSLMNQGANGQWLTKDSYTSEPHQSSIIFSYFLLFGKISSILGIPYPVMYHIIRIIFAVAFLFSCYLLLYAFSIPHPRLTYILFLFASPLMHEVENFGTKQTVEYMNWWTGMDPIRRAVYLPHHMIGAFLLIISLMLITKYTQERKWKFIIELSVIAIILAFIHTPSLFIILIILPPALIVYKISQIIKNNNIRNFPVGLLGYWVTGLLVLLFMVSQTGKGFPWSQYIDWEKSLQFPLDKELIGAFGFLLPFSAIGILKALKSEKFQNILIVCWFVVPLCFIPFASVLNISNIRLIQGVPYLPLAILAVFGMKEIGELILKVINSTSLSKSIKLKNWQIVSLWYGLFLFLFAICTIPTLTWSLKDQIREFWPIYGNVYLDNKLTTAFSYMNQNLPKNTITVSTFYSGNYLPAFTHTTSFIGHSAYTYNLSQKEPLVKQFFSGQMLPKDAKTFLESNKIDIVFQGPEEVGLYEQKLYPEILKPIFQNDAVILYKQI